MRPAQHSDSTLPTNNLLARANRTQTRTTAKDAMIPAKLKMGLRGSVWVVLMPTDYPKCWHGRPDTIPDPYWGLDWFNVDEMLD